MLTLLLLLPLAGALTLVLVGGEGRMPARIAAVTSLAIFGLALFIAFTFDANPQTGFAFEQTAQWLPSLGARYSVGIDGISLMLILLTAVLAPITAIAASSAIATRQRQFYFWFLVLNTAMLGAIMSRDLFLFFVFWELMLIPMYLMIGIWGGANRIYAGLKFFLYTVVGSLPMLVAFVYLAFRAAADGGTPTFDLETLRGLELTSREQFWCFLGCGLSFAVKMPLWPFHTWLPDAHTEAPTPGSVLLAGVLLKMGGYGFIRIAIPLFPEAAIGLAPIIDTLAVIAIVAGSLVAMVQTDLKRLVAYSSVAHMGAVVLGIFCLNREGMAGGVFQMLAHGISTGGLFLLVGFLYERRHTRAFADFGGLAKVMPLYCACFIFVSLSSIALPGLNGFVGEFLILAGAFRFNPVFATFAVLGTILGAWYMLAAVRRVFFGPLSGKENQALTDLTPRELGIMVPLMVLMLWMGIFAHNFLDPMTPDLDKEVVRIEAVQKALAEREAR